MTNSTWILSIVNLVNFIRHTVSRRYFIPILKGKVTKLPGSKRFGNYNLSQDYWQLALNKTRKNYGFSSYKLSACYCTTTSRHIQLCYQHLALSIHNHFVSPKAPCISTVERFAGSHKDIRICIVDSSENILGHSIGLSLRLLPVVIFLPWYYCCEVVSLISTYRKFISLHINALRQTTGLTAKTQL